MATFGNFRVNISVISWEQLMQTIEIVVVDVDYSKIISNNEGSYPDDLPLPQRARFETKASFPDIILLILDDI